MIDISYCLPEVLSIVICSEHDFKCRCGSCFDWQAEIQFTVKRQCDVEQCSNVSSESNIQLTYEVVVGVRVMSDEHWTNELNSRQVYKPCSHSSLNDNCSLLLYFDCLLL